MPRKSDEIIKGFIGDIGVMIDARNKTLEINLKAHTDSAIKASEDRIRKDMATKEDIKKLEISTKKDIKRLEMATKEDIKRLEEKMATKEDIKNMATKDDIKRLEQKVDKTTDLQHQLEELKERVKTLEESARVQN